MERAVFGGYRVVDELGRVILPADVRVLLGLEPGDCVLFVSGRDGAVEIVKARPGDLRPQSREGF